jgi:hypothetical protein
LCPGFWYITHAVVGMVICILYLFLTGLGSSIADENILLGCWARFNGEIAHEDFLLVNSYNIYTYCNSRSPKWLATVEHQTKIDSNHKYDQYL